MQRRFLTSLVALTASALAPSAKAQFASAPRVQFDQRGDFVMFGNSAGYECDGTSVAPVVGTFACNGSNEADSSPDEFWRSDSPGNGEAEASGTITPATSRTTAVLNLPPGATVTYARLYWAGYADDDVVPDTQVTLLPPGGVDTAIDSDDGFEFDNGANSWYQSTADITTLVQNAGTGAYRLSGLLSLDFNDFNNNDPVLGWVVVVMYQLDSEPPRNLALFDGLERVNTDNDATVTISDFLVPAFGFDGKLGVLTYEGENSLGGDALLFGGTALFDDVNPVDNFFNSSRSYLGSPFTVVGDLPQLSGEAASMSGLDFDVVDVTARLTGGQTSATITATSDSDTFLLGAFVTSISTYRPDFTNSNKTFVDLNGGVLKSGDTLEYTVFTQNEGNDTSIDTVMTDPLPVGLSFVPGTLQIGSGTNAGTKTDAAGDDQGEYDAATRTIVVRLGTGADGTNGGEMAPGESATIKFQVTIDSDWTGTISNQAIVSASGDKGAPAQDYPTDGDSNTDGPQPTDSEVEGCELGADCPSTAPVCDLDASPNACVECLTDADCGGSAAPNCLPDNTCGCAAGPGLCEMDTDGDGLSDDDGLFDGTELGFDCAGADTAPAAENCSADADAGATTTDPLDADTDDGGVSDGSEDTNLDGAIDAAETNPNNPADDTVVTDSDGDGLSDDVEETLGSDPNDADSDDDGAIDGEEANPGSDSDGDDLINVLDPDSDDDGLFDGTELGFDCDDPATDAASATCIADADPATTTSPLDADTDDGGVSDGVEDTDHDGEVDAGERDPNEASDDDDAV
ncbi:MAG TPA: hypothetical protein VM686_06450, partial [Polyangiaceae bacterium]|nr:hypothetical protein [Polyangiaceae bacterium]